MLQTILKFEYKQLLRNRGSIVALIIFCLIGLFCIMQGKAVYHFQQTTIDSALAKKERNFAFVQNIFDTLTYKTLERNSIEEPFVLEWRLQDVVAKESSPLSILSIGQSDIYTPLLSGHFNNEIFKNNFTEFKNPEQLLAGNLDTAYFVLFLFPLLLLALSYNSQSAEKEAGISPLLTVQATSVTLFQLYKLLFRWLVALVPVLLTATVSFFILNSLPDFSLLAFIQWWGIAFLYAIFWFVVVLLVQKFHFNSLVNAITLAGIWVMLLIAIPGFLNTWFNYQYPATNKTEIAEYRDYDYKAWDQPSAFHKNYLFNVYPSMQKDSLKLDSNNIRSFGYAMQVMEKEKALHEGITNKASAQARAEENSFWLNPIGGVMRSFATLSNASLKQQHQFEKAVLQYREQKLAYIFKNVLLQPHFTKEHLKGMPEVQASKQAHSKLKFLLPIVLLTILLLIISLRKEQKSYVLFTI